MEKAGTLLIYSSCGVLHLPPLKTETSREQIVFLEPNHWKILTPSFISIHRAIHSTLFSLQSFAFTWGALSRATALMTSRSICFHRSPTPSFASIRVRLQKKRVTDLPGPRSGTSSCTMNRGPSGIPPLKSCFACTKMTGMCLGSRSRTSWRRCMAAEYCSSGRKG